MDGCWRLARWLPYRLSVLSGDLELYRTDQNLQLSCQVSSACYGLIDMAEINAGFKTLNWEELAGEAVDQY